MTGSFVMLNIGLVILTIRVQFIHNGLVTIMVHFMVTNQSWFIIH